MPAESELIDRAKAGDRDALNELVSSCWTPIYRFVSLKTGNPEDAQEITQDTFFRAFRALATFQKTEAHFTTFLGRIALNLITDFWRKKGRSPLTTELTPRQELPGSSETPEEHLLKGELRAGLAAVISELPEEQRQVIEWRILAGLPVKDVALALGKSEAAVKMLQQRALKTLREKLLDRGVIEK